LIGTFNQKEDMPLLPSLHVDTFARDNLPPESEWPVFSFELPGLHWPEQFNCAEWLLERALAQVDPSQRVWSGLSYVPREVLRLLVRSVQSPPPNSRAVA
jgi:hypothetical protein